MKRNLIYLSLVAIMLVYGQFATAQRNCVNVSCDTVRNLEKRALIMSNKLMLDEKNSEKFIPLYSAYLNELASCSVKCDVKKNLTDDERLELLEDRLDAQVKCANVKKEYISRFSEILTPRQVEKVLSLGTYKHKRQRM